MTPEREAAMFKLTDYQFAESGGVIWTPRELSDEFLQDTLDLLNWRKEQDKLNPKGAKHSQHGDTKKIKALVDEKMRRELVKQAGQQTEQSITTMEAAPKTETPQAVPDDAGGDELTITITDSTGRVLGELTAAPRTFKTGSTGYYGSDKVKDAKTKAKYQVGINMVRIGSKSG